jgi:uncharacterized protein YjbI with pentapeptide repeats
MSISLDNGSEFVAKTIKNVALDKHEMVSVVFDACEFKDCHFGSAVFTRCKFVDCVFVECNLSNAKIAGSKFLNAEFSHCKMIGINWPEATWLSIAASPQLTFWNSNLNDSSFFGLKLHEMVIQNCTAHSVDFRAADLTRADLTGTDLQESLFGKTILIEADLSGATNYNIDVLDNNVRKARFSRHEALGLLSGFDIELVD